MNQQEQLKAHVIECCVAGRMTVKEGAERLSLSERQVKRLKRRVKENGAESVLHRNCGRQPKHTLTPERRQEVLEIKARPEYENVNFLHFQELLEREHKIKISYSALRNLLLKHGHKSPKTHRKTKPKHPRRPRKECFGEMLQGDASRHQWFKNDDNYYTIHGLIDDATNTITGLYMCENECMEGYMQVMRQTISSYGVPKSLYLDGLSTFFGTKQPTIEEQLQGKTANTTQFGAMMGELGVGMIHARSSQAKGRIEREWETFQGRLETEFAIRGITTPEQANEFFPELMKNLNNKFCVLPAKKERKFMPKPKHINLDRLFAVKKTRIVDNSGCFTLDGIMFQTNIAGLKPQTKVQILISKKLGVKVVFEDKLHKAIPILDDKKRAIKSSSIKDQIADCVRRHCLKDERAS